MSGCRGNRPGAAAEGPEARVEAALEDFLRDFRDSIGSALRRFERDFLLALAACLVLQDAVLGLMLWWL